MTELVTDRSKPPILLRDSILALAVALWADLLFSVGWTFSDCLPVAGSGHGSGEAAYGLPFPYMQWSSVSSLEYDWIPWILALNITLLTFLAMPFVCIALRYLRHGGWRLMGLLLLVMAVAIQTFRINTFLVFPVDHFRGGFSELSFSELRPVAVYFGQDGYDCTPSPFWFPAHRS